MERESERERLVILFPAKYRAIIKLTRQLFTKMIVKSWFENELPGLAYEKLPQQVFSTWLSWFEGREMEIKKMQIDRRLFAEGAILIMILIMGN